MHTENNQTKKNKRALLLLLVLGVFGFGVFKYTKVEKINASVENPETCIAPTAVSNNFTNKDIFISMTNDGVMIDITPELKPQEATNDQNNQNVLGGNCRDLQEVYKAESACTISTGRVSVDGSNWVSDDANIDLVTINYPVYLLSGKYSIKDSNRLITLEDPIYKPAGEQFDDNQLLVNIAPGETYDKVKSTVLDSAPKKQAFGTKYSISTEGSENNPGNGSAVITEYATNDCEQCNNPANNNPAKSNSVGKALFSMITPPGQEKTYTKSGNLTINGMCESADYKDITSNTNACTNTWYYIRGTLRSLFPSSDWTKCKAEGEGCVNSENIVVKMSPIFDDTNTYTSTRNKIGMSPSDASSYQSVYIMTPCVATVGGKDVNIKCVWDMSYLFDERKVNEFDDAGGSDTPTAEQYIQYLQQESTSRNDTLLSM